MQQRELMVRFRNVRQERLDKQKAMLAQANRKIAAQQAAAEQAAAEHAAALAAEQAAAEQAAAEHAAALAAEQAAALAAAEHVAAEPEQAVVEQVDAPKAPVNLFLESMKRYTEKKPEVVSEPVVEKTLNSLNFNALMLKGLNKN